MKRCCSASCYNLLCSLPVHSTVPTLSTAKFRKVERSIELLSNEMSGAIGSNEQHVRSIDSTRVPRGLR